MMNLRLKSLKGECAIFIKKGALDDAGKIVANQIAGRNTVVVADENTYRLFGDRVKKSFESAGFRVSFSVFVAGEASKTPTTLFKIYEDFHEAQLTRSGVVIALGGGVVGDVSGFAAATYLRGVPVVQIPTTLLSQVDSSIGGKTGIDMPFGKNSVGAFYQPIAVITDPDVLSSLPERVFSDGMAEVIKYGCIRDEKLFQLCLENIVDLNDIICRCIKIKCEVVEADEFDKGERMLLNFGHTVGHAIEKSLNFAGLTHGEAVGLGMIVAAEIGEKYGNGETKTDIIKAMMNQHLPLRYDLDIEKVCNALGADKKRDAQKINYVVLEKIGKGKLMEISLEELKKLVKEVLK